MKTGLYQYRALKCRLGGWRDDGKIPFTDMSIGKKTEKMSYLFHFHLVNSRPTARRMKNENGNRWLEREYLTWTD